MAWTLATVLERIPMRFCAWTEPRRRVRPAGTSIAVVADAAAFAPEAPQARLAGLLASLLEAGAFTTGELQ